MSKYSRSNIMEALESARVKKQKLPNRLDVEAFMKHPRFRSVEEQVKDAPCSIESGAALGAHEHRQCGADILSKSRVSIPNGAKIFRYEAIYGFLRYVVESRDNRR